MEKYLASSVVIEGQPINLITYIDGFWILLSDSDIAPSANELEPNDFYFYSEQTLFERIPAIKGKLNPEDDPIVTIDEKTGQIHINKKHRHIGFSTANAGRATNQANVELSYLHYLKSRRKYSLKMALTISLFLMGGFFVSWVFYFFLARILFMHGFTMTNDRNIYLSGTLNPGIVISINPLRIAVLADLGKLGGGYPIIRVKKVELPEKYREIGKRIPVAGKYYSVESDFYWDYYNPLPIPSAVNNKSMIEKKANEISTQDWIKLFKEEDKLPTNVKEGYYLFDKTSTRWKNVEQPSFIQINEEK